MITSGDERVGESQALQSGPGGAEKVGVWTREVG